jgi:hypothetical protein
MTVIIDRNHVDFNIFKGLFVRVIKLLYVPSLKGTLYYSVNSVSSLGNHHAIILITVFLHAFVLEGMYNIVNG